MNSKVEFKSKTPIIVLSIIGLVFEIVACSRFFVYYGEHYSINIEFSFASLISLIISLSPMVIFLVYLLKFHENLKAPICVPIVLGLIAFIPIYSMLCLISVFGFYNILFCDVLFEELIYNLFYAASFILATISALNGFSKKTFTIIAFSISFLLCAFSVIDNFFVINLCHAFGTLLFYISLFIFAINNRIPAITTQFPNLKKKKAEISPEQELIILKNKLDIGMISEEEYKTQRAEIISKL